MFNKYYLDYELKEVLRGLHVEPPLQPPIEGACGSIMSLAEIVLTC